jgi:hypothetical protein
MSAILQEKLLTAAIVLLLAYSSSYAQIADDHPACPVEIQSLKDAASFASLAKDEQVKVLRALGDDIAEMAEIDMAASQTRRAAYRNYFISHLRFKALANPKPAEQLLMIRYDSNTMCGSYENCPVWIVRLTHSGAQTMVPWQNQALGTSAGGSWAVGVIPAVASEYPELLFLTHLSSLQTALACYRESKGRYLRVDCSPECARRLEHEGNDEGGR